MPLDEIHDQISPVGCPAQRGVNVVALAEAALNEPNMGIGFQDSFDLVRLDSMLFPSLALNVLQPDDSLDAHAVALRERSDKAS